MILNTLETALSGPRPHKEKATYVVRHSLPGR